MRSAIAVLFLVGAAFGQSGQRAHSTNLRQPFRAHLGVGVVELTDERVKALKLPNDHGLEVRYVEPNSPASRGGLKESDVILEVNSKTVENNDDFLNLLNEAGPGAKISLTVWRNSSKQTLTAMLEANREAVFGYQALPLPPNPPLPPGIGLLPMPIPSDSPVVGFWGEELGSQLAEYFGVKQGVLVESVNANTPASRAGLKAGDVVTKVNGTPVTTPREISFLARDKRSISFTVVRNKKEMTLNIELAELRTDRDDL